ncbi:hypothetical protein [Thalassococcus sp. S3]|uniref:hypothetical protein n=1 Tax=Thalassococcus sp. S3 TaxID=2017482 RepID=UPI0010245749|nr:hypothetical protein [Thalassococcus sp. S3]QBF33837.1 hypothetical protein CFI11_21855 [Thalassococcus sp. S3]
MSNEMIYDPLLKEREKQPPLELGPIPGVLPYAGHRSPLSRSSIAHKISMVLPTPATKGVPRVYHFESAREAAVGLEAVISPELYELEVQLPPIPYQDWQGTWRKHSFDARITFRSGFRRAVFVRNGTSLRKPKVQADITAIFAATPASFADDKVVVNGDLYTRGYRDNLFRVWEATKRPDQEADVHLLDVARRTTFWDLGQLIRSCELEGPRAFDAALRLIGCKALGTNWHTLIWMRSRVWVG